MATFPHQSRISTNPNPDTDDLAITPAPLQNRAENPFATPNLSRTNLTSHVSRREVGTRYDPEVELQAAGKKLVLREKRHLVGSLIAVNFFFIFATWWWPRFYYIFLPFITLTVFLNSVMVCSVIIFGVIRLIWPEKRTPPTNSTSPETLVHVVPCYNETPDELTRSLDSLITQTGIQQHRRAIIIICDGKVRGPGMNKTSAASLFEDILIVRKERRMIKGAYIGWSNDLLDVEVQSGTYKDVPYFCIVKQQNQGKRDSLICIRSFLHTFNIRHSNPVAIFSDAFFNAMTSFLTVEAGIENVDYLIGMDADTVFEDACVSELIKEAHYPDTIGVCGYVGVDFSRSRWKKFSLWSLYQSTEYTISQGLRRFHQSTVTKKVSCLPGCCQLLKVCETTCGNRILYDLFGYCPKPNDALLKHIRATASEDRNHVCLMLSAFPKAQTRQALRAIAYTDVPHSWSVFLSQRRRWTLGATANDLFLITAPGIQWFERILATANVLVWFVNIFVFASIVNLVVAALHVEWWIILAFSSVMIFPVIYYICIVFWIPRTVLQKFQYLLGLVIYLCTGPIINIIVLLYALWNLENFGWGKTRKVVTDMGDGKAEEGRGKVATVSDEKLA